MISNKDEVIKLAEEILSLLKVNGYNIEQMTPEEVSKLVDEYLKDMYEDFIDSHEDIFREIEFSYESFEDFYKTFTKSVRNKEIHIESYLN
ncbi:hypothetical protein CTM_00455 [Clostridium tetanomorphum DSM 665]|uniref:Uncharacterized protein n=1 Tax=Clostridium tetanomorphum TaxID=1553 RepID=A0A923E8U0_CLOTT|nr:hypothetical protein [Clostridium tetanomorphum]KAJ53694.1 hypothetical protein CTM_00455 [Clostridium tetanomorphum DSM 665]MBC2397204.1 hypothetical protein [Clostridium tetanomorphum]MBP1862418.1 phosphate uptake regulator [Clostridium tetanomorphum]NRZ96249.1 phosphate uptake regulator [Clostridium tetanomorphum]